MLFRTSGATLYYQRRWAPRWMTVAGASASWAGDEGTRAPDALRRAAYASANVIHVLTPDLVVGAEALWGEATRVDGSIAGNHRLQLSARYLMY